MWLVLVVAAVVILVIVAALVLARSRPAPPPPPPPEAEDRAERRARQERIEERGAELLDRRADLDARRGALFGRMDIDDAFTRLEERLARGEITSDEFEREKVRLLGG